MSILLPSIVDRIRAHHQFAKSAALEVKGYIGKEVSVQENEQDRFLTVMATTSDVDLEGDVVVPEGADTQYFFRNRKITVDHFWDTEHCVGQLHSANLKNNGWLIRFRMFDVPLARDILTIAREGGIGVSIGFSPTDFGPPTPQELTRYGKGGTIHRIHRAWRWIETSIAAFPMNVACQTIGTKSFNEGKRALLDELVTKGRINLKSAVALGLPVAKKIVSAAMTPKRRIIVVD